MTKDHLSLAAALTKLNTSKQDLSSRTKFTNLELQMMNDKGVSLQEAEQIANAYGVHPTEIWGDNWVEAILSAEYLDSLYQEGINE